MPFNTYLYQRPDLQEYQSYINEQLILMAAATKVEEQATIISNYHQYRDAVNTMITLVSIRHSINTNDEYYRQENDYMDEHRPLFSQADDLMTRAILGSPWLQELKQYFPEQYFTLLELQSRCFAPKIVPLLQQENQLTSKYAQLLAGAQISFNNETLTLAQLTKYTLSDDRELRRKANEAKFGWFKENDLQLDQIFDQLVKLRHQKAVELGFENYIELGYLRMGRSDYTAEEVAKLRQQIIDVIVPINQWLYRDQQERLGLEELHYFDERIEFSDGNPVPKGDVQQLIDIAAKMYHELSPQTDDFFQYMVQEQLFDLEAKEGKAGGGYCTYLETYQSPFIFANFNGTAGDVHVLTHEAGHAFNVYSARNIKVAECMFPTMESAEIHSMTMELLTRPWMEDFFQEDTKKFLYAQLVDALKFIPYGALVDHFQHEVYAQPELTASERKYIWYTLEKEYLPHKNYQSCEYLLQGNWWKQQSHIYMDPFYYIDYAIAQLIALQFYTLSKVDKELIWERYVQLCQLGGSLPFKQLLAAIEIACPFDEGVLAMTINGLLDELQYQPI